MTTNYTSYAQHSNVTITVTSTAELNAALANLDTNGGGTILLDGDGGPYRIQANDIGDANNPILIKGLDPANQPLVQNIYLLNSSHITMTDLHVDSTGTGSTVHDLRVSGSDNIEFVDNTMTSTADGFLGSGGSVTKGASAALIRDSQDIVFNNNILTNYGAGTTFLEVNGLDYSNNDISGFQYDGFAGGGLQNVTITNNYMHDFWGSTQIVNHSDYIMIWGTNANSVTSNIDISNNIIDTGASSAYQGIFIGNNEIGTGGASGQYFQDIQIHDNIVHTSMWHGIYAGDTQNLSIYNNAVLFNEDSFYLNDNNSSWTQAQPWIMTRNAPNALVYGNISGRVSVNGTNDTTNNDILDYNDSATDSYVDNLINGITWSAGTSSGGSGSNSTSTGGSTTGSGSTTDTSTTDTSTGTDTSGSDTGTDETTTAPVETVDTSTEEPVDEIVEENNGNNGNNGHGGKHDQEIVDSIVDKSQGSLMGKFDKGNGAHGKKSEVTEDEGFTLSVSDLVSMFENGEPPESDETEDEETDVQILELI